MTNEEKIFKVQQGELTPLEYTNSQKNEPTKAEQIAANLKLYQSLSPKATQPKTRQSITDKIKRMHEELEALNTAHAFSRKAITG